MEYIITAIVVIWLLFKWADKEYNRRLKQMEDERKEARELFYKRMMNIECKHESCKIKNNTDTEQT